MNKFVDNSRIPPKNCIELQGNSNALVSTVAHKGTKLRDKVPVMEYVWGHKHIA